MKNKKALDLLSNVFTTHVKLNEVKWIDAQEMIAGDGERGVELTDRGMKLGHMYVTMWERDWKEISFDELFAWLRKNGAKVMMV